MFTANIIFFVSGQAGVALEGSTVFCAPIVWEGVAEDSAFSEPVAVPMTDCNFMQMVVRLLAERRVRGRRSAARLRAGIFLPRSLRKPEE